MNALNWRLSIFFQDLSTVENGLNFLEGDDDTEKTKSVPEVPDILAMLVKEDLHFQYIQIKIKEILGFIEKLRNQMKTYKNKVGFKNDETDGRECPKFRLDNPWDSIHDIFKHINEEILYLKYDFEKLLDYLENDE